MNLPTIPTDNLYKFLSIAGLTVVLLSVVLPYAVHQRFELQLLQAEREGDLSRSELDLLVAWQVQTDSATYRAIQEGRALAELRAKYPFISWGPWDAAVAARASSSYQQEVERRGGTLAYLIALEQAQVKVMHEAALVEHLGRELLRLKWIAAVCIIIGLLLAGFGFRLWYRRLQYSQDRSVQVAVNQ